MSDIVGIDPGGEMSGVAFEPTEELPGGLGSLLGSVGSIFGPAGMAGMMGAGGMPPIDLSSRAESRAISGGTLTSGPVTFGQSYDTLIIGAVVVLGLLIVFGRKK